MQQLKFLYNFARGFNFVLFLHVMPPHVTPVKQVIQLCPLRFSVWTYPKQGSFHEEQCKGAWLASRVFVVLMPTHKTPVKNKKRKKMEKK